MQNWKNYLVCVCTPISGNDEGVYGTAVPVGPGLLLTARHVVRPSALVSPRQRHPKNPILIRWWYATDPDFSDFVQLPADHKAIVWESRELDVVLLKVPYPSCDVGRGKCRLLCRRPTDGMHWFGEGFPKVYEFEDERRPQSCGGTVYSKAGAEDIFEITADRPERDGDWSGASGMPVMVGDGILGIVRQMPQKMLGGRLHATPVWKLLEEPTFQNLICPDEDDAIQTAALGRVSVTNLEAVLRSYREKAIKEHAVRDALDHFIWPRAEIISSPRLSGSPKRSQRQFKLVDYRRFLDERGGRPLLIVAESGHGKTTLCYQLAKEIAKNITSENLPLIPI